MSLTPSHKRLPLVLTGLIVGQISLVQESLAWTQVGTGIEYQEYHLPDPNNVFVTRMDRRNPLCFIETSLANGRSDGAVETISGQFNRYDGAVAYWGQDWGRRSDVVAAINGDYWDTNTYIALGPQVQGGWVIKTRSGPTGSWTCGRDMVAGYGAWCEKRVRYATGAVQGVDDVNIARGSDTLILYTNHYGANTKTNDVGVEVLVEMMRPAMVLTSADPAMGIIRQVRINQGSTPVPFDHVVLSASGTAATTLQANASVGSPVHIYDSISLEYFAPWLQTYSAIGGILLLQSPLAAAEADDTGIEGGLVAPRTVFAANADYVYFVVVDGRSTASIGMDFVQLMGFCRDTLGATDAISCDGGGSSCMVVNGAVKNAPSDGRERAVPNGLLMCVLDPKQQSTSFNVGDTIRTTSSTTMRTGPGTNYLSLTSLSSNRSGVVLDHSLRGIHAKGTYWWKCDINGYTGWVSQSALTRTGVGNLPVVAQHPADTTVCPGTTATFQVAATGTGMLTYQWQHHGEDLADDGHYSGTSTATLTISGCEQSDLGGYRCVVADDAGPVTSYSAALFLYEPTVIHAQPLSQLAHPLGGWDTVSFNIETSGESSLSYRWQRNQADLNDDEHYAGTTTTTLTISGIDSSYEDTYRCRVSSPACGTIYSDEALLTVISSDLDGDGDGDQEDFGQLQACLGVIEVQQNAPECVKADINGNRRVDISDVSDFRTCFTGAGVPLPPGC